MNTLLNIFKIGFWLLAIIRMSLRTHLSSLVGWVTFILLVVCFFGWVILEIYYYIQKRKRLRQNYESDQKNKMRMEEIKKKNQKTLRITIISQAIMTLILPYLYFLIIKFGGYWATWSFFLGRIFFIGLSVGAILLIFRIIKETQWRNTSNYFTLASALVSLCIYLLSFKIVNGDTFQSTLKIRAHYEYSRVGFRENGKFEIFSWGNWGYIHHSAGNYTQKNDSLFLDFTKIDFTQKEKYLLADTLIIKDSILYKVQNDSLISTHYHITDRKNLK